MKIKNSYQNCIFITSHFLGITSFFLLLEPFERHFFVGNFIIINLKFK